jgi:hypothetical protein
MKSYVLMYSAPDCSRALIGVFTSRAACEKEMSDPDYWLCEKEYFEVVEVGENEESTKTP